MNILFPKISFSLGKKPVTRPSNPFTTKSITLRVPALKAKVKTPRIGFALRSPFVKRS